MIKYFVAGFFVKVITSLDDTITHIPVIASITKTRIGRIAFSLGNILAVIAAIFVALFFSSVLHEFPYYRFFAAGIVFLLAILIYFDVFVHKPRTEAEKKLLKIKRISAERFTKLLGIGFLASVATVIDDVVAYMPLFLENGWVRLYVAVGIIAATILEIIAVIYFSERIAKLKYKEEIASAGLAVLGFLILFNVV